MTLSACCNAAQLVDALLWSCAGVRILATSREPLGCPGETTWRAPSPLLPRNAPALAEICRRLDGIPLALELTTARVRVFALEQLALRLDDRFRLLTSAQRTAMPRQQQPSPPAWWCRPVPV